MINNNHVRKIVWHASNLA